MSIEPLYNAGFAAGVTAERERCARIAEAELPYPQDITFAPLVFLAAVRAVRKSIAAVIRHVP